MVEQSNSNSRFSNCILILNNWSTSIGYNSIFIVSFLLLSTIVIAQKEERNLDQIIAVVGENIILSSELNSQIEQYKGENKDISTCSIFEDLLYQSLLVNQAKIDSIDISEQQIEGELNRRISVFVSQIGSEEKLEAFYNKSIVQIKEDFHDAVQEQLLAQQMQSSISGKIKITPTEVRSYFNEINKDSLPLLNSEIELAHIVKLPPLNSEEKKKVKEQMEEYRKRIVAGEDFGTLAYLYSQDPGSAQKNGELGFMNRNSFVKEFAAAAFQLKTNEISPVIETEYGFHILQMIARRGDDANIRHILLTVKTSPFDLQIAKHYLDSILNIINTIDTVTFELAAQVYSTDKETKNNGGVVTNPQTGTSKFEMDQIGQIDPGIFFIVDKMEVGDISKPVVYQMRDGKQAYRIVKLLNRTKPHKANLKDDYIRIKDAALIDKQNRLLGKWIDKIIVKTYIKMSDEYTSCTFRNHWKVNL